MNKKANRAEKQRKAQERAKNQSPDKVEKINDSALRSYVDQAFEKYDADQNGKLDFDEIKEFLMTVVKDKMGLDPTDGNLLLQFEHMDLDGSGDIDKEELYVWLKDQRTMNSELL